MKYENDGEVNIHHELCEGAPFCNCEELRRIDKQAYEDDRRYHEIKEDGK